jgi:hypothetical protein
MAWVTYFEPASDLILIIVQILNRFRAAELCLAILICNYGGDLNSESEMNSVSDMRLALESPAASS